MNYQDLILNAGHVAAYLIIFGLIFCESGLFFAFFLPGDSLLFGLGIAAAHGYPNIFLLIATAVLGAILGVSTGYAFGKRLGPGLFDRPDSRFFKKAYLQKAHDFYQQQGRKTLIIARFTPVVRTFASIVAGIANMEYVPFFTYNLIGAVIWVSSMSLIGYFLGNVIPNIDHYVLPIVGVIIVVSVVAGYRQLKNGLS